MQSPLFIFMALFFSSTVAIASSQLPYDPTYSPTPKESRLNSPQSCIPNTPSKDSRNRVSPYTSPPKPLLSILEEPDKESNNQRAHWQDSLDSLIEDPIMQKSLLRSMPVDIEHLWEKSFNLIAKHIVNDGFITLNAKKIAPVCCKLISNSVFLDLEEVFETLKSPDLIFQALSILDLIPSNDRTHFWNIFIGYRNTHQQKLIINDLWDLSEDNSGITEETLLNAFKKHS